MFDRDFRRIAVLLPPKGKYGFVADRRIDGHRSVVRFGRLNRTGDVTVDLINDLNWTVVIIQDYNRLPMLL